MKTFFAQLIIYFLFISNSYSQSVKVEYDEFVTYTPEIVNNDRGFLFIDNNKSSYKTIFDFSGNNSSGKGNDLIITVNETEYFSEIFTNIKVNTLVEKVFELHCLKKFFYVEEEVPKIKWVLNKNTKKIKNYLCHQATATFRGRTYTAWYTESIPVPFGPWKLSGCPGLILDVEDKEGVYKWKVSKIISPYKDNLSSIFSNLKESKFKQISYRDYDALIVKGLINKASMMKSRSLNSSNNIKIRYSTTNWKEPVNEWRTETEIKQ